MTLTPLVGGAVVTLTDHAGTLHRITRTDADAAQPWTETTYTLETDDGLTIAGLTCDQVTLLADGRDADLRSVDLTLAHREDRRALQAALVRLGLDITGLSSDWQDEAAEQEAARQHAAALGFAPTL